MNLLWDLHGPCPKIPSLHAQTASADSGQSITIGAFVDAAYAFDVNWPATRDRAFTTQPARHSVGVDVQPEARVLWRTEARGYAADAAVFPRGHRVPARSRQSGVLVTSLALTF